MAFKWWLSSAFAHVFGTAEEAGSEEQKGQRSAFSDGGQVQARDRGPLSVNKKGLCNDGGQEDSTGSFQFQMPLHYPRYSRGDYEKMEEWRLDLLLQQYGLKCEGSADEKRAFAMGAFLWPDQL